MPTFDRDGVSIYYEEQGSGFPVLLIAPGGMRSAVGFWQNTPWNPIEHLSPQYRVIAMDQRNAGRSKAPVSGDDGWHTFTADQLALMDHLGVDRFAVAGMCIGGSYIMALAAAAPERVAAGVVFQTIGLDANRDAFYDMFDSWANDIRGEHPEASDADWKAFRERMYGGDDFLFTASHDDARACPTPLLVLLGNDLYHPESSSRQLAELAPHATLVEKWKEPAHHEAAKAAVASFLAEHCG
ncbi:MAG: alpha/beta hydrolase [Acidimicrobiia bacterium]|nr:alpha/beta hydrolase [Acidimicrobiia bacterium]